jgi:hypothetical protein
MLDYGDEGTVTFQKLERPLKSIDGIIQSFAQVLGARVEMNYHGQPSRSVLLKSIDGITRKLQISPRLLNLQTGWEHGNYVYSFSTRAWKDVKGGRYISEPFKTEVEKIPTNQTEIIALLSSCWRQVQSVTKDDLKFMPTP